MNSGDIEGVDFIKIFSANQFLWLVDDKTPKPAQHHKHI